MTNVIRGDQDVRGLDVAVDDSLLMRVLDRLANLDKQVQTSLGGKLVLVAVVSYAVSPHQFHHKIRAAGLRCRHSEPWRCCDDPSWPRLGVPLRSAR